MKIQHKERPILFSGPMVRAIREGRKTQTRRIVKPQPRIVHAIHNDASIVTNRIFRNGDQRIHCPCGQPGDWLWVKETWRTLDSLEHVNPSNLRPGAPVEYRVGGHNVNGFQGETLIGMGRWRPSIFMSKWMSRVILEIVSVRVERLNDITEDHAKAEGVEDSIPCGCLDNGTSECSSRCRFKSLWESINGPGSWDLNPWVWVVEFKEVKP